MKRQIVGLIIGIALLSLASAMYSGECNTIEFPNTDDVEVRFEGNSSNMDGFYWNKSGTTIKYCTTLNFKPDNFTATWFNYQEVYVEESSDAGQSSGSSSKSINKNVPIEISNDTIEDEISEDEISEDEETTIEQEDEIPKRSILFPVIFVYSIIFFAVILMIKRKMKQENRNRLEEEE